MTYFGPVELSLGAGTALHRRKRIALSLIKRFAAVFDDVAYELLWDVPIINAQAWTLGGSKRVTVCGGLARYPGITACGFALMLAHETGHHLGGRPLDPDLRWPTWQGQADFWAAAVGMPKVFGSKARRMTLRGARQIAALHTEFFTVGEEPDISAAERTAIFSAGALGEAAPAVLQAAFDRMLKARKEAN